MFESILSIIWFIATLFVCDWSVKHIPIDKFSYSKYVIRFIAIGTLFIIIGFGIYQCIQTIGMLIK